MHPDPAHPPACVTPTASTVTPPSDSTSQITENANQAAVPFNLAQPIGSVTTVTDIGSYIAVVFRYVIGLAATAAVIMIVYGGFRYLLGSAMSDVGEGKKIIQDAIMGLLLVLGSYFILNTVNPNTLSLKLPNIQTTIPNAYSLDSPTPTNYVVSSTTGTYEDVDVGTSCTGRTDENPRGSCTVCTPAFCAGYAVSLHKEGTWVCDPGQGMRCSTSNRCVARCGRIDTDPAAAASTAAATRAPLPTCSLDRGETGCAEGQSCLRTGLTVNSTGALLVGPDRAAKQGYCTDGREGSRCRCSLHGCDLTESGIGPHLAALFPGRVLTVPQAQALQPTNNGWLGTQTCQAGLRCVSEGTDWYCRRDPSAPTAPTPTPAPTPAPGR